MNPITIYLFEGVVDVRGLAARFVAEHQELLRCAVTKGFGDGDRVALDSA